MFRRWRLKKIHAKFLESCRNLKEGHAYWDQASGLTRWFLQTVLPIPLLGLHDDGKLLLEALQWLEAHCHEVELSEEILRQYHRILFRGSATTIGGEYRRDNIILIGSAIPRPPPERVPVLMKQLNLKLVADQKALDTRPIDKSALFMLAMDIHQRIGLIHPFSDGNGRVARLAMNHLLRRYHYGYVILPPLSEAQPLMDALQDAHRGRLEPLVGFAKNCVYHV